MAISKKSVSTETPIAEQATPNTQPNQGAIPPVAPGAALDLTAYRLPQSFGAVAGVKKVITTVPVRKPSNQIFVRVRPGEEWQLQALVLQLKEDGECYLVAPGLYGELAQEARAKQLYTYVTRDGNVAIWPINMPGDDGRLDSYSQSAHTGAEMAEKSWVRMVANRTVGAYDVMEAANLAEAPVWPDLTFQELLNLAFRDRLITSVDHPIVKKLRGEI